MKIILKPYSFNRLLVLLLFLFVVFYLNVVEAIVAVAKFESIYNNVYIVSNNLKEDSGVVMEEDETSSEDVNELYDSNITTKIYKSSDPALDLLDDKESMLDQTLEGEILNKDELISMSKIIKRKSESIPTRKKIESKKKLEFIMLPWVMSIILVFFLTLIFRFLVQKTNT